MEETTVEDQPQEEQEQAETEEQPEQAPEQGQDEQDEQDATEAPADGVETPASEEEEDFNFKPEQAAIDPLTAEDLKVNPETGEIDVNSLLQTFNDRITQAQNNAISQSMSQVELRDKYKQEWDKAETKYPDLKTNPQLREWVFARHNDAVQRTGKWKSPTKAADEFFSLTKAAKAEGIKTAETSTTVQKSAALETSSNSGTTVSTDADLSARINSTDPMVAAAARREFLKKRIQEGRL